QLGVSQEDLIERIVERLADGMHEHIADTVKRDVFEQVQKRIIPVIDAQITKEMEVVLSQEIQPVTMWSERTGKQTTIREQLAERARVFWTVKVDDKGKEQSFGGAPRCNVLLK